MRLVSIFGLGLSVYSIILFYKAKNAETVTVISNNLHSSTPRKAPLVSADKNITSANKSKIFPEES